MLVLLQATERSDSMQIRVALHLCPNPWRRVRTVLSSRVPVCVTFFVQYAHSHSLPYFQCSTQDKFLYRIAYLFLYDAQPAHQKSQAALRAMIAVEASPLDWRMTPGVRLSPSPIASFHDASARSGAMPLSPLLLIPRAQLGAEALGWGARMAPHRPPCAVSGAESADPCSQACAMRPWGPSGRHVAMTARREGSATPGRSRAVAARLRWGPTAAVT